VLSWTNCRVYWKVL